MKELKDQEEIEKCTFAPKMVTRKKSNAPVKRDLNKFLEDQAKYEEMRRQKAQQRMEGELEKESKILNQAPKVNPKSRKMLEGKDKVEQPNLPKYGQRGQGS